MSTLQAAPTLKDRKEDPEKKKTTTKVAVVWQMINPAIGS